MSGNAWMKVVGFVLLVTVLGALANMLLDPGLGRADDEGRRMAHKSGFSMVAPRNYIAEMSTATTGRLVESMLLLPERSIGHALTITITRLPPGETSVAETHKDSQPTLFQGKPARKVARELRNRWAWHIAFTREEDGGHYEIAITSGIRQDIETGPLWPFLETFRPGKRSTIAPSTVPATAPAADPTTPDLG